jgi:hypothetical protein
LSALLAVSTVALSPVVNENELVAALEKGESLIYLGKSIELTAPINISSIKHLEINGNGFRFHVLF